MSYPNNGAYTTQAYNSSVTTPIIWVDNEISARNSYIAPGTTGFFMERQNPRFYVKSATLSGEIASFRVFEFNEIIPEPPAAPTSTSYVTVDDFNKSIDELKQLINQKNQSSKYNKEKNNV